MWEQQQQQQQPVLRAIGVSHTQLAKMTFDKLFDLTAGVNFYFYTRRARMYIKVTNSPPHLLIAAQGNKVTR